MNFYTVSSQYNVTSASAEINWPRTTWPLNSTQVLFSQTTKLMMVIYTEQVAVLTKKHVQY